MILSWHGGQWQPLRSSSADCVVHDVGWIRLVEGLNKANRAHHHSLRSIEHDGIDRLAAVMGERRSAAIRRMIRAVTRNLDLFAHLDINASEQELREARLGGRGDLSKTGQDDAVRLIGALLTAYRETRSNSQMLPIDTVIDPAGDEAM